MKIKLLSFLVSFGIVFLTFLPTAHAVTYSYSATNFQSTGCLTGSEFTQFNLTSAGDVITITGTGFGDRNLDDSNPEMVYIPTSNGVVSISQSQGLISWHDSEIQLKVNSGQGGILGSYIILRTYPGTRPDANGALSQSDCNRATLATYVPPPPTCTTFTYSDWGTCTNDQQTRTAVSSSPNGCTGGSPVLTQSCTSIPACTASDYSCAEWSACATSGQQTRSCTKTSTCEDGVSMPSISQSCTYTAPTCTSWTYSNWGACSTGGQQTRTIVSSSPTGCIGGSSVASQSCTPPQVPPRIISVTPNTIKSEGTEIEIVGTNFGDNKILYNGRLYDHDGGTLQQIISWSNTRIRAIINLKEWNKTTNTTSLAIRILCLDERGCESFNGNGANRGDDIVSNSFPITVVSVSCGEWGSCMSNNIQKRYCQVLNGPQRGTSLEESKVCVPAPRITSINPSSSYFNQEVDIIGTGFGNREILGGGLVASPGAIVAIDGQTGKNLISWTDTKIRIRITDPNKSGTAMLVVSIPEQSNSNSFPIALLGTMPPACTSDTWSCGVWGTCSGNGLQNRTCTVTSDCPTVVTPSPAAVQACTPAQPACNADVWTCGGWDTCSLSGIQNRSCTKTFDCPSAETAPPTTSQYCESPNRPQQAPPTDSGEVTNQDIIIRATVKLMCPFQDRGWSQGSGTVIDPSGIVLTNKHVVSGTLGCLVGFINNFNDEPYFGERQIADIVKVTPNADIAILKIRNPQNQKLTYIDIKSGNSSNLRLGDRISIYGYPGSFGANITYTSGDFSGTRTDSYLKTTAILEHGNSGGGAYLRSGTFLGIPSEVTVKVKDTVNVLGYILPVNVINAWLGNSRIVYNSQSNNNYSRVSSILENFDLKKLGSVKILIPDTDASGNRVAPVEIPKAPKVIEQPKVVEKPKVDQKTPKVVEKVQPSKPQEESIVIESPDQKQSTTFQQPAPVPEKSQPQKNSRIKRLFRWAVNIFKR